MGRPVPSERAEVVFCPGLEGANSLRPPDGAHRVVPQGAARGNVAEQREICSGSGWGEGREQMSRLLGMLVGRDSCPRSGF